MGSIRLLVLLSLACLVQTILGQSRDAPLTPLTGNDTTSVIGGFVTTIENYPYQGAVFGDDKLQFCGCNILSPTVCLTAQHCMDSYDEHYYVGAGRSKLSEMTDDELVPVQYIINYPRYASRVGPELGKDVSILILSRPLVFGTGIQSIGLVSPQDVINGLTDPGTLAKISGWGNIAMRGTVYPDQLRAAAIKITSLEFAIKRMGKITLDQIPAGDYPGSLRSKLLFLNVAAN
jgi:secreted trypsin-like serine protease